MLDRNAVGKAVVSLLDALKPGWDRDKDMAETARRVTSMWCDMINPQELKFTTFDNTLEDGTTRFDQIILQKDIPFQGVCSHHLLPFFGTAHVGYIPDKQYVGLSKLARVVDVCGRRLSTQEDITEEIAQYLERHLQPIAVGVIVQAEHMCMRLRGIQRAGVTTTTSAMYGAFRTKSEARAEFLHLVNMS